MGKNVLTDDEFWSIMLSDGKKHCKQTGNMDFSSPFASGDKIGFEIVPEGRINLYRNDKLVENFFIPGKN